MKKRYYLYISLFLSLILFVFLFFFFGNYKRQKESFSSLCITNDEYNQIISTRSFSDSSLIKELIFDGNELFYDKEDNRFYYSLVKDSKTAYNPNVEWSGIKYNVKIKDTKITDDLIHHNEDIELIIYNNNTYSLAKLTCTTLPLMNVNVDAALEEIESTYQDARMILFDNENNVLTDLKGEIRTRGSHTLRYPKKSFKLKLKSDDNESISLLGLRNSRDYILYAGYNDQERIRNVFSTNLWYESCAMDNSFDIVNGQYYKYYEMFINNKYWGLYAIATPIDEFALSLDLNENSSNYLIENLYKKMDFEANEYNTNMDIYPIDGYQLKTNVDCEQAWKPLGDFYKTILNTKNIRDIYDLIDVDNCIDIFLFYNLIQGVDNVSISGYEKNYLHNTFMFSKAYGKGYKMLYCPWDMDNTWGNSTNGEYGTDPSYNSIMYINPIFNLLNVHDDRIIELVENRYKDLRNTSWSINELNNKLSYYNDRIFESGAYSREVKKWPDSAKIEVDNELIIFSNYVNKRMSFLDSYINDFLEANN